MHRFVVIALVIFITGGLSAFVGAVMQDKNLGYQDTPIIPGSKWHVHDGKRPQPRMVVPPSPGKAPSDAVVLFDGTSLEQWTGRNDKASWRLVDGTMEVNGTGSIRTRREFGSCQLHIEWATPAKVKGSSQGRGNSGVFLMGRYEIQVLDSFKNPTYPDGQAGAIYGQCPPLVNASRGPAEWQSYDIIFEAPKFKGKQLASPARVTVLHNGILLHHKKALLGPTTHRRNTSYRPHGPSGPIELQDHGNPIRYRNIWVRPLTDYDTR